MQPWRLWKASSHTLQCISTPLCILLENKLISNKKLIFLSDSDNWRNVIKLNFKRLSLGPFHKKFGTIGFDISRKQRTRPEEWGKATSPVPHAHSFRTSFYLFAAVRVPIGLPNLPQTVFREWSSVYNHKLLIKTGQIRLFKHGSPSIVSLTFSYFFFFSTIKVRTGKTFLFDFTFLFPLSLPLPLCILCLWLVRFS